MIDVDKDGDAMAMLRLDNVQNKDVLAGVSTS